jgi:hypothetical protein
MTVAAACGAWYLDISDSRLESSCARAGWNLAQDGSENMRAGVVLPSSGAHIYPSNDQFSTPIAPSQAGFGVSVIGKGPEVVVSETAEHQMPQLEPTTEWKELVVMHEESDSRKDFLSEKDRKQEERSGRKSETVLNPEEDNEEPSEEQHQHQEENDQEEEEEALDAAVDETKLLAEAGKRLGCDVTLQTYVPEHLDQSLVGSLIAFHDVDGWDTGTVIKYYTEKQFTHAHFNYDIRYSAKNGSVRTLLRPELYGTGDEHGAPLSSWVILHSVAAIGSPAPKKKRRT